MLSRGFTVCNLPISAQHDLRARSHESGQAIEDCPLSTTFAWTEWFSLCAGKPTSARRPIDRTRVFSKAGASCSGRTDANVTTWINAFYMPVTSFRTCLISFAISTNNLAHTHTTNTQHHTTSHSATTHLPLNVTNCRQHVTPCYLPDPQILSSD